MRLTKAWRWFGPDDPVKLQEIRQCNVDGIVTSLLHFPVGEVWELNDIITRKKMIEDIGFEWGWLVAESLNVHESIKLGMADRDHYIANYVQSLQNLAKAGVKTVCYNFMPILDWVRSHYHYQLPNGAETIYFNIVAIAAFDLFMLKRKKAETDYESGTTEVARNYYQSLSQNEKKDLQNTILGILPGTSDVMDLDSFRSALRNYERHDAARMKENLHYFLEKIIPVADSEGILMAIHPDDPPFPVLGLPRVVSTQKDLFEIMNAVNSRSNGFTFCTGSLGVRKDNNLLNIIQQLGHRINYIHLRNIKRLENTSFRESDHLKGDIEMEEIMKALITEDMKRKKHDVHNSSMVYRPDHGFKMLDDFQRNTYPGYSAVGRLKALAQLEGLEKGIRCFMGKEIY